MTHDEALQSPLGKYLLRYCYCGPAAIPGGPSSDTCRIHYALAGIDPALKEMGIENGELRTLISQALPFMKARHEWKPTAPHADMIRAMEAVVVSRGYCVCRPMTYQQGLDGNCIKCKLPMKKEAKAGSYGWSSDPKTDAELQAKYGDSVHRKSAENWAICGWCAGTGKKERTSVIYPKCKGAGGKQLEKAGNPWAPNQDYPGKPVVTKPTTESALGREMTSMERILLEAVREFCSCGGAGPENGCTACKIWHRHVAAARKA